MQEQRQFARLDTRIETTCRAVATAPLQRAVTKNISAGGICIFLEQELAPGTHLEIAMTLPGQTKPIIFTGEVVWSEAYEVISKTQRKRSVEAGIRFVDIKPKARETLLQHVILAVNPSHKTS